VAHLEVAPNVGLTGAMQSKIHRDLIISSFLFSDALKVSADFEFYTTSHYIDLPFQLTSGGT